MIGRRKRKNLENKGENHKEPQLKTDVVTSTAVTVYIECSIHYSVGEAYLILLPQLKGTVSELYNATSHLSP